MWQKRDEKQIFLTFKRGSSMKRRSMTGYGKAMRETPFARWLFEISSVNRKGLDITVNLPPFLIFLDPVIRQWVAKSVERGTVTVRIGCELKGVKHVEAHLKAEKKRWEKIGKSVNASPADITLPFLLMQTSAQQVPLDQEKVVYKEAKELWDKSAAAWLLMKEEEGRTLAKEVKVRVKLVQKEVKEIEQFLPQLMEHYLDKIMDRLKQFKLDPEKLKAEAIL